MWQAIARVANEAGCTLTVYIDDVTLSGAAVPNRIIWDIRRRIHSRGLRYHKEKRFTGGVGEVTGVLVDGDGLRVPNRQHKKAHEARARLAETPDPEEAVQLARSLRGLAEQRRQVERRDPSAPSRS
jgi:hypothetical protein